MSNSTEIFYDDESFNNDRQIGERTIEVKKYVPGITNPNGLKFYINEIYDKAINPQGDTENTTRRTNISLVETDEAKKARFLYEIPPIGPKYRIKPNATAAPTVAPAPAAAPASASAPAVAPASAPASNP